MSRLFLKLDIEDGEVKTLLIHYFDATVRLFRNKPWASHLDVDLGDRVTGVSVEQELIDDLLELHYPYTEMPYIDTATLTWLADRAMTDGRPASCDNCGSERMHQHTKKTYAKTGWKMQYKCYDCGAYKLGSVLHRIEDKTNRLE